MPKSSVVWRSSSSRQASYRLYFKVKPASQCGQTHGSARAAVLNVGTTRTEEAQEGSKAGGRLQWGKG